MDSTAVNPLRTLNEVMYGIPRWTDLWSRAAGTARRDAVCSANQEVRGYMKYLAYVFVASLVATVWILVITLTVAMYITLKDL